MNSWVKKIIIKWLTNVRRLLYSDLTRENNPYNISFGDNAKLGFPFKIGNGHKIRIGANSGIGKQAWIETFNEEAEIIIEDNVWIGNFACITAIKGIFIKKGVLISEYLYISDHSHGYDPSHPLHPIHQPLTSKGIVEIGENCFIGYRVTILPGVKLGNYCVVGSHSVVTKSFPDYTMVAGVPAKPIKKYDFERKEWVEYK